MNGGTVPSVHVRHARNHPQSYSRPPHPLHRPTSLPYTATPFPQSIVATALPPAMNSKPSILLRLPLKPHRPQVPTSTPLSTCQRKLPLKKLISYSYASANASPRSLHPVAKPLPFTAPRTLRKCCMSPFFEGVYVMAGDAPLEIVRGGRSAKECMSVQAARYEDKAERRFERRVRRRMERLERLGDEALTYYPEKTSVHENENSPLNEIDVDTKFERAEKTEAKQQNSKKITKRNISTGKTKAGKPKRKETGTDQTNRAANSKDKEKGKTKKRKRAISTGTARFRDDSRSNMESENAVEQEMVPRAEVDKTKTVKKVEDKDCKSTVSSGTRQLGKPRRPKEVVAAREGRAEEKAAEEKSKQRRLVGRRSNASAADDRIRRSADFEEQ